VEVSSEGKLVYLGRLPQYTTALPSLWREIKGYKHYIVIGSEAYYHGVQIFDMIKLLHIDPAAPVVFSNEEDLTGYFNELPVGRSHNVVVNEEKNYAIAVGSQPRNSSCAAGLVFIDLTDPTAPTSPGCASGDGYVHDAQCLVYRGPDGKYNETEICYGYDEDTLTIFDVTDKNTTKIISRTGYEGASYTHQGWVLNKDWQQYLVLDDEYDEYDKAGEGAAGYPVTYFWDITSLEAPKLAGFYRSETRGVDHNQFVINGIAYQSNYGTGLRILDLSSLPQDPTGAGVKELGFFDIYPEDDALEGGGVIDWVGTWSHYPYFKSGFIVVNTIERGAFVVKRNGI
jgi:choice-of-anchor B domain-containing protein